MGKIDEYSENNIHKSDRHKPKNYETGCCSIFYISSFAHMGLFIISHTTASRKKTTARLKIKVDEEEEVKKKFGEMNVGRRSDYERIFLLTFPIDNELVKSKKRPSRAFCLFSSCDIFCDDEVEKKREYSFLCVH